MTLKTFITARANVQGVHHWPKAPGRRNYLQKPHRHEFHVSATVEMAHDDRDVEFHDLGERLEQIMRGLGEQYHTEASLVDFGSRSCEALAREVFAQLQDDGISVVTVLVSEDGQYDGIITSQPAPELA